LATAERPCGTGIWDLAAKILIACKGKSSGKEISEHNVTGGRKPGFAIGQRLKRHGRGVVGLSWRANLRNLQATASHLASQTPSVAERCVGRSSGMG